MKPTQDIIDELRCRNRWLKEDLLEEAAERLEHLFASGIHTCHADCQRPMCVLRRERDAALKRVKELEADNARYVEAINKSESVAERGNLIGEIQSLRSANAELAGALREAVVACREHAAVYDSWRLAEIADKLGKLLLSRKDSAP